MVPRRLIVVHAVNNNGQAGASRLGYCGTKYSSLAPFPCVDTVLTMMSDCSSPYAEHRRGFFSTFQLATCRQSGGRPTNLGRGAAANIASMRQTIGHDDWLARLQGCCQRPAGCVGDGQLGDPEKPRQCLISLCESVLRCLPSGEGLGQLELERPQCQAANGPPLAHRYIPTVPLAPAPKTLESESILALTAFCNVVRPLSGKLCAGVRIPQPNKWSSFARLYMEEGN